MIASLLAAFDPAALPRRSSLGALSFERGATRQQGHGRAMPLEHGILFGPVANLGDSLGHDGHRAWRPGATWHE